MIKHAANTILKAVHTNALLAIRTKSLKKRTIRHGFHLTGIEPFNPKVILNGLPEPVREETPATPSSHNIMSIGSTPRTTE
jgi:hypothetical protein